MTILRHHLEYALLLSLKGAVRLTPFCFHKELVRALKWLVKKADKKHYIQVMKNLKIAFPEMNDSERNALREKIYQHFSSIMAEWLYLFAHRRRPPGSLPIELVHPEHLQTVLDNDQGAILVSAHFGNWEMIPFILKDRLPSPLIAIARPMNNPKVEGIVSRFRDFMGSQIIYKKGALRKMIALLKNRRFIYLLVDQNAVPREAVFVDFFSQKVSAITSAAQIHLKRNVPLLPLFLHYGEQKIYLEFLPPIMPATSCGTVESVTQDLTHCIENQIRKNPEQWFWFHNRWKTKPNGAAS